MNAVDEARGKFGDWIAECQTYEEASQEKLTTGLVSVIGQYTTGIEQLAELDHLQATFESIPKTHVPEKEEAARKLIRRATERR